MDIHRFSGFATKKQRSSSRKPRSSIASLSDRDIPLYSSPPCSDNNGNKLSPRKNPEHSSSLARKDIKNVEGNGNLCSNGSTENKLKTLKLKVRIRTNANSDNQNSNSNTKPLIASEASKPKSRLSYQDNVDNEKPSKARGNNVLQGVSSKDNNDTKDTLSKVNDHVRKGNRAPRKRSLDEEEEEDDEIRYLQKMKSSKVATDSKPSKSVKTKHDIDEDFSSSSRKKMKRSDREANDGNHVVEEENTSGLTKRQRALHNGGSSIEFPDGLPPAPSRKQKLTEEEKLAKKVEAAQRRKMQVEKANRESEAEAIRKILGQDSNRKKKEEKLRKQRDDLAQKKAEEAMVVASNSIRYVMRPSGNIVTFGEAIGLPSIFSQNTISYPPPREKCAGPSCTNAYKYRDSKSNLPLCSLQCYRAVQESSKAISC